MHVQDQTAADNVRAPQSGAGKLAVAAYFKQHTQASKGWLAGQLHLGAAVAVSH